MDACSKSSKSRQNLFTDILELSLDRACIGLVYAFFLFVVEGVLLSFVLSLSVILLLFLYCYNHIPDWETCLGCELFSVIDSNVSLLVHICLRQTIFDF